MTVIRKIKGLIALLLCFVIFITYLPARAEEIEEYTDIEAGENKEDEESTEDIATNTDAETIENIEEEDMLVFSATPLLGSSGGDTVTLTKGKDLRYPAALGNYSTCYFYIDGKIAYCLESSKKTPSSGEYAKSVLESNENLQKALYYGYGGTGDLTDIYLDQFDADLRYIFTHLAASYFYAGMDGFHGCTQADLEECGVWWWISFLSDLPAPHDPYMSLSQTELDAYVSADGTNQVTDEVTFNADSRNCITMSLPSDVTIYKDGVSQTGGDITIYGGSKFYFSAPLSKTGSFNTGEMTGNIKTLWEAIAIKNADSLQDIGSYQTSSIANSVALNVNWLNEVEIKIKKVDSESKNALLGAEFGVYSDSLCTNLITTMPKTKADGTSSVKIIKTQDVYYLREISAPENYVLTPDIFTVNVSVNNTAEYTIENDEQKGSLTVCKEGEELTGATITDNKVTFNYEVKKQKGALFSVYAGEDIYSGDGDKKYNSGALIAKNLVTDESGSVTLTNLYLGKYKIIEDKAPTDYTNSYEEKYVTISYAGQTTSTVFKESTYNNQRVKANVSVLKTDNETNNPLKGGIYSLYAGSDITNKSGEVIVSKNTLIESVTTDNNGKATFTADIPIGFSYYVKENKAPDGYVRDETDIYTFKFDYVNQDTPTVSFSHTFKNKRVNAKISLTKKDSELLDTKAQGDATLFGAVYGLYAREDILHPDNKTGVIYKKDTLITTLTTNKDAYATVDNLYLGKYYLKEITAPTGYVPDTEKHNIDCTFEGDSVPTVKREAEVLEEVNKQPFSIIKIAGNKKTDADLIEGAGFSCYLVSSLSKREDGSFDFDSADPVVIGENGATIIFTDEKGYAESIPIPYGKYIVKEVITPHNLSPVDDFYVDVNENKPNEPQVWRVLVDEEFEAKLFIYKKDDETKKPILKANTEFKIYDMDSKSYIEQITTYPEKKVHTSYFTNDKGCLLMPETLKIGNYRIEEITAPEGYILNNNYVEFSIDSNTPYLIDNDTKEAIITIDYMDESVKGNLTVIKKGEVLTGYEDADFTYEVKPLSGAEFSVYASEDIFTPDMQVNEDKERILIYSKNQLVDTLITNDEGKAVCENLPLGKYYVVETKAPYGFFLNPTRVEMEFTYKDQDTPIIYKTAEFMDDRQKVDINVVKKSKSNDKTLSGAEFSLYANEDIKNTDGDILFEKDSFIGLAVSDENGNSDFGLDLPLGSYYIKETKAPDGYLLGDQVEEIDATYKGEDLALFTLEAVFKNEPTRYSFTKKDITNDVEIEGANLSVFDEEGMLIDNWTSQKGKPHIIEGLVAGKTYTLKENLAPFGYLKGSDINFKVEESNEIIPVVMYDEVPKGKIVINKYAEKLDKVNVSNDGLIKTEFVYKKEPIKGVIFNLYADENITNPDGESSDYYKKGELVGTYETNDKGVIEINDLPLGKYCVKEISTADGYILDDTERKVDISYKDQNESIVEFTTDYVNERYKAKVDIIKTELGKDIPVKGATFGLYVKEDILNDNGDVVINKDTLIEEIISDDTGKAEFTVDIPIGYSYYVKEVKAASGYVSNDIVYDFKFSYKKDTDFVCHFSYAFENDTTKVEISKVDITGYNLPGATLSIIDDKGCEVISWTTTDNPYLFKKIPVGTYTLHEVKAPDGYEVASDITFEVKDSGEITKVEMTDLKKPDEPKTGDKINLPLIASLIIISGISMIGITIIKRRKK